MVNFIIILVIILIIFYYSNKNFDFFVSKNPYPYNPQIQTPQSNYNQITSKLNNQDKYKYDISVALGPTPTIHCDELDNRDDCNKYGCNWFGTYCSAMYPSYL